MKKKIVSIVLFLSICFNTFGQATVLTAPGSETFDPAGWLKMIDELGQMYDLITYNITQIENQYKQIENYVNAAKGIDWSNIEFDGDFDIRNDIKDANKKVNKLITQARNIRDTLEKPSINCGTKKYSIKDLVGGNGYDNNIFAALNTMKTYMTTEMESAIDGMVNGLSEKEKRTIWNKYGISPKNFLFVQQSMNQIKNAAGNAIGIASENALDLIRAQKVTETNNILKAAYNSLDKDGNITEGAARESLLLMSEQVVDGLMSLEEAINEVNRINALKLIEEQAKEEAKAAHQAEVEAARRSLDSMTPSMFRKMGNTHNEWIDVQVCEAIDYFSSMLTRIGGYIRSLATLFGVLGLLWAAFKLLNSRITVKDLWWDILYKWLSFIVLVNLYVPLCSGILWCANYFGTNLGIGKEAIVENLKNIKTETEAAVQGYIDYCNGLVAELETKFPDNNFMSYKEFCDIAEASSNDVAAAGAFVYCTISSIQDGVDSAYLIESNGAGFKTKKKLKEKHSLDIDKSEKEEYKKECKEFLKQLDSQNFYSQKLLESLNRILIVRSPNGEETDNLSEAYFDINMYLKDSAGNETVYIAPSSLLRVGIFCAQLFWEQSQFDPVSDTDSIIEEEKPGFFKRTGENIVKELLTGICCICIVLSICFVLLQYIMCIIEYVIICSLGFLFIPMILFDGTKELPKKLIPTLMGFFIKMLVMNVCTFFVFYLYLEFTSGMLASPGGLNWATIATIFFNCLLGFVLTQNAPKVSQTLLTGQPQLSMGEAVAAGATALGAARVGTKGAKLAGKGAKLAGGAVRGTVNGGTNILGAGIKAVGAAGAEMKNWSGGGKFLGAVKGFAGSIGRDIGEGIKSKGEDFLHGGKGGSGGGTGAGGKLHGQSGTYGKTNTDKVGQSISNVSNPKFQNATVYDKELDTNRNMSYKEFFQEKWNQGLNSAAQNESKAAESQQTKNLKDAGIGNNLDNRKNENTV